MSKPQGVIALMGSGELTSTMVEVHKQLLGRYSHGASAVFIDTPAGFQLNVDHLSRKASDYFTKRLGHPLQVASLKSADTPDPLTMEESYRRISQADYLFIGPGSPTYALSQWQQTRVPVLMAQRLQQGATLVAASAAALTIGRHTLPVYEIYKVGQVPHWVDGLDILGSFGMDWAVVPHWNNAEGGNHDTRFCFMGAPRLKQLTGLLPPPTGLLGLDEHTALLIDIAARTATVKGMGTVTLRLHKCEYIFKKGDQIPFALLQGQTDAGQTLGKTSGDAQILTAGDSADSCKDRVWQPVESLAEQIQTDLQQNRIESATHGLLELERHIQEVWEQLQERSGEGAAREVLRNMLALFGTQLAQRPLNRQVCLEPLIGPLLDLRAQMRATKQWAVADAIRDCLAAAGIVLEDTPEGICWRFAPS